MKKREAFKYGCVCYGFPADEIKKLILDKNLKNLDNLKKETKIGSACGRCKPYIQEYLDTLHTFSNMKVQVLKNGFENNIKLPAKQGDVGFDLVAATGQIVGKFQGEERKIEIHNIVGRVLFDRIDYIEYDTGVIVAPTETLFSLGFPRSGLSKYSLLQCNSVGVIDSGYRGTIKVRFKYIPQNEDFTNSGFLFDPAKVMKIGDRVDQLVFANVVIPELEYVDKVTETERGGSGFGSTGK